MLKCLSHPPDCQDQLSPALNFAIVVENLDSNSNPFVPERKIHTILACFLITSTQFVVMMREEYSSLPVSSEDVSSESDTFLIGPKIKTRSRTTVTWKPVAIGLMVLTTLLNGISLYLWLQSTTNASCTPPEHTLLNYYRKPSVPLQGGQSLAIHY
jgi:hypothetical protein